ncbi:MAG: biotin/lipoate A/B protein ligase family protein [Fimbriimonadales bacterium]
MAGRGHLSSGSACLRLLNDGFCPPEVNMARDVALLDSLERGECPPTLRVYQWASPALTYGVNQELPTRLAAGCERLGIPMFRRPTGGKAVLHGHDLTLALVWQPAPTRLYPRQVYLQLAPALIEAFETLGVPALQGSAAAPDPRSSDDGGDCFATPAVADIVHAETGVKLMGCALLVRGVCVLMQASIPLRPPDVPVEQLFGHPHPQPPAVDADSLIQTLYTTLNAHLQGAIADMLPNACRV